MPHLFRTLSAAALFCLGCSLAQSQEKAVPLSMDWNKTLITSRSTPTLQVVVNPMLNRGAKLHDPSFAALKALGADYVRYVPWLPYPRQAVAELSPPSDGKTSWDFAHIDPTLEDFMNATQGHSVILNFSTIPAWMYKTDKPVTFPEDPNQVFWNYTQGTVMRDPTMHEAANYFARLLSWYTKGGFTDELGHWHASNHHYKIAYWEVLNEIEFEHSWTPEEYTKFYDVVTTAMRAVDPDLKFVAGALGAPSKHPEMFEYFLNPANHKAGVPLDFISYHFYATPSPDETIDDWQFTFFDQAEGFLNTVRFADTIRRRYSPSTRTDLDELGAILPEDGKEIEHPGYVAKPEPPGYYNLAGAMFAYLYVQLSQMGIDVIGESQLVGYKSQYPSVSMMNYVTGNPNPRYWILKLLRDHLGPGNKLVETSLPSGDLAAQAYQTSQGKQILLINKRNKSAEVTLPKEADGAALSFVAPSTGDHPPAQQTLHGTQLHLDPFEVAIIQWH